MKCTTLLWITLAVTAGTAQNTLPVPLGAPKPGPATDAPYAPQPILQGGVVVTLFRQALLISKRIESGSPNNTT